MFIYCVKIKKNIELNVISDNFKTTLNSKINKFLK